MPSICFSSCPVRLTLVSTFHILIPLSCPCILCAQTPCAEQHDASQPVAGDQVRPRRSCDLLLHGRNGKCARRALPDVEPGHLHHPDFSQFGGVRRLSCAAIFGLCRATEHGAWFRDRPCLRCYGSCQLCFAYHRRTYIISIVPEQMDLDVYTSSPASTPLYTLQR